MTDDPDKSAALALRAGAAVANNRGAGAPKRPVDTRRLATQAVAPVSRGAPAWAEALPDPRLLLDMRRRRRTSFFAKLFIFVMLPTLATLAYSLFIAAPRSTSEFQVTYQTYRAPNSLSAGLVESVAGTSQTNNIDLGTILYQYIRSPALLNKLDQQLDLRGHFSDAKIDYLGRMNPKASSGRFLQYYRWHVSASEGLGGYVSVEVQTFDPAFTKTLAKAIVTACEEMMNDMTARARHDGVQLAQDEVNRQEERVRKARQALTEFQNAHNDIDPNRGAAQLGQIVGSLESDLANARAQLANSAGLADTSPIVIGIKSRIASLDEQLRHEQARLAGTGANTPYSKILDQYSALQLDEEFAKTAYTSAQQGLSVARADAARTQNYLIVFAPPNEPDTGNVTSSTIYTLSVFLGALLLFGIVSLMFGAFRDQAGF